MDFEGVPVHIEDRLLPDMEGNIHRKRKGNSLLLMNKILRL